MAKIPKITCISIDYRLSLIKVFSIESYTTCLIFTFFYHRILQLIIIFHVDSNKEGPTTTEIGKNCQKSQNPEKSHVLLLTIK